MGLRDGVLTKNNTESLHLSFVSHLHDKCIPLSLVTLPLTSPISDVRPVTSPPSLDFTPTWVSVLECLLDGA